MNVRWTGTLPYTAAEVYDHLAADMRLMRRLQSEGHSVPEMNCAFYVAWRDLIYRAWLESAQQSTPVKAGSYGRNQPTV